MLKQPIEKVETEKPSATFARYEIIGDKMVLTVNGETRFVPIKAGGGIESWDNGWSQRSWNRN